MPKRALRVGTTLRLPPKGYLTSSLAFSPILTEEQRDDLSKLTYGNCKIKLIPLTVFPDTVVLIVQSQKENEAKRALKEFVDRVRLQFGYEVVK